MLDQASHHQHRLRIFLLFLPIFLLVISACFCQSAPYADLLTTKEPKAADVVGTYILTTQTLTDSGLDFLEGKQSTIEINQNGTFTLANFPIWQKGDSGEYILDRVLLSAVGNLSLEIVTGVSSGGNNIKSVWVSIFWVSLAQPA
jgi:hypothetical protein